MAHMVLALADGATCLSDLAVLRDQPALAGPVASEATAWRTFNGVGPAELRGLAAARAAARERGWAAGAGRSPVQFLAMAKTKTRAMSDDHKAALAEGRTQGRAVRAYLEALESNRPKRGRKRTPESIAKRLAAVEAQIDDADPLKRLQFAQERIDLQTELDNLEAPVDLAGIEAAFTAAAKGYGERKGISYAAWREVGVPASTLKAAGITRG